MAYDEDLADRLRWALQDEDDVAEKRMFGGLAFLVGGHMSVTASREGGLLLRVDPDEVDGLVAEGGVARAVMGGRAMRGWVRVDESAIGSDDRLRRWVAYGVRCVRSLPPK